MKAWQFTGTHQPLQLNDVAEPEPGPHEVLIDVKACGLCHSDVGILEVEGFPLPMRDRLPVTLGHEVAGVISRLGSDVSGWQVGDRVAIGNMPGSVPGLYRDGGFAPRITSGVDVLVRIPDSVGFEQAAVATDAGMSAHGAVVGIGRAAAGEKVGIIGFGGLGQLGARVAHLSGCDVYVAEPREETWPLAHEFGAVKVVADVLELAGDELDLIVDFAGVGTTTASAIESVGGGGRVVQVGMSSATATIDTIRLVMKRLTLSGSLGGTMDDTRSVVQMIGSGELVPTITTIAFREIPEGLSRLSQGAVQGRLVAVIDG